MAIRTGVLAVTTERRSRLRRALARVTVLALVAGVRPAWAAAPVADPRGGASAPKVETAPNGVTVVQITDPSAGGVSRNKFTSFDVDPSGVILNNATGIASTQLAGYVAPNQNLKSSAKVILNEVTGATPSLLAGYLEVAGQKAEVVIANQSGITCDGCGFINVSRGTLTTGTPVLGGGGSLEGYRVLGGSIQLAGAGLDAKSVDQLDLLSRTVTLNAGLWANRVEVVTGANEIRRDDLSPTPLVPSGAAPQVSLDVGALGGMYAGKIRLVGTERGVGVTSAGTLAAAGDFTLQSDGRIVLSGITTAGGALSIQGTQGLDVPGTVHAGEALTVSVDGRLTSAGVLAAAGGVSLSAGGVSSSGTIAAGVDRDGALTGDADLLVLSSGDVASSGKLLAGGSLAVGGDSLDLRGATVQAGAGATLQSSRDLLAGGARLEAGGLLSAAAGGTLEATGATLRGQRIELSGADVGLGQLGQGTSVQAVQSLLIVGTNGVAATGALLHAGGEVTLYSESGRVEAGGADVAGSAVSIDGQSLGLLGASVGAQGALTLQARDASGAGIAANGATLQAGGALTADSQAGFQADGAQILGQGVALGGAALSLRGAAVRSTAELGVTARDGGLDLTGGTLDANGSLFARAAGELRNAGGSVLGQDVTIEAGSLLSSGADAVIAATGDVTLLVSGGLTNRDGALIYSGGDLFIAADEQGGRAGDLVNEAARIEAAGSLSISAASLHNRPAGSANAFVIADRDLVLSLGLLANDGSVQAGGSANIAAVELRQGSLPTTLTDAAAGPGHAAVGGANVDPNAPASSTPDFQFTVPTGGLYHLDPAPGHPLVETDPRFTDLRTFLTSDYMLGRLPSSPDSTLKRLGDGFYEEQLILDQLAFLTGRRFLEGQTDAQAQYQALMDEGIRVGREFQLSVGVALSAEQMARLTTPMVWLVKVRVQGQDVLVPHVYVPTAQAVALSQHGTITAGSDLALATSSDFRLGQTGLAAGGNLSVQAKSIQGDGGSYRYGKDLTLVAQQSIDLAATQISTGGNLTLLAQDGNVTATAATRQTLLWPSGGGAQRDVTVQGAQLTAGGSVTIGARGTGAAGGAGDVRLDAAAVKGGGTVTVFADRDVVLGAAQERHETTSADGKDTTLATATQGTSLTGGEVLVQAGNDLSIVAGVLAGADGVTLLAGRDLSVTAAQDASSQHHEEGKDYQRTDTITQARSSVTSASGAVQVSAGRDAQLAGAQLQAGGDVLVRADRNASLTAVSDSTTVETNAGRHTTRTYDEKAQGTALTAAGAATVAALGTAEGGDAGTGKVLLEGATVQADGGAVTVYGKDVAVVEAREEHDTLEIKTRTKHGFLRKKTITTRDEVDQDLAVEGLLSGAAGVVVQSEGDLVVRGGQVVGGGDVSLQAHGDLSILAAEDRVTEQHLRKVRTSGLLGAAGGGVGFTVGTRKEKSTTDIASVSHSGSTVGSVAGGLSVEAGGDVTILGSDLASKTDTSIAGKSVTIGAVDDTQRVHNVTVVTQDGLSVSVTNGALNAAAEAYQAEQRAGQVKDDRLEALYALRAVRKAQETRQALSGGDNTSVRVTVGASHSESRSESTTQTATALGSSVTAEGDISIVARGDPAQGKGDLTLIGSALQGRDVTLDAARDLSLLSAANQLDSSSGSSAWSATVGVAAGGGKSGGAAGFSASGSVNQSDADERTATHTEATIDAAGQLSLKSGRDTTLRGAVVKGDSILAVVGRNLSLESEQDLATYKSTDLGASGQATVGYGVSASLTLSAARMDSTYRSVQQQTGLFAGQGGYDLRVGGNTDLEGAVIASGADPSRNRLDTGTLTHSDLDNVSKYTAVSASATVGTGGSSGVSAGVPLHEEKHSTTRAAVSAGTLTVRGGELDLASLSRDTDHATNAIANLFDKASVEERKELVQVFGEEAFKAVGDLAQHFTRPYTQAQATEAAAQSYKALLAKGGALTDQDREALASLEQAGFTPENVGAAIDQAQATERHYQEQYDTWKDGSAVKTALHAAVGAIQASLAGGSAASGAIGAGTSEALAEVTAKLPSSVKPFASLVIGGVAAKLAGAGGLDAIGGAVVADYGYKFNRRLHEDEKAKIKELAEKYHDQWGVTEEQAEQRLTAAACAKVRCAEELPDSDPNRTQAVAFQQSGSALVVEQAILASEATAEFPGRQSQSLAAQNAKIAAWDAAGAVGSPPTYSPAQPLFDYSSTNDALSDQLSRYSVGTRVAGSLQLVGGTLELGGSLSSAASCLSVVGCGIAVAGTLQGWDTAYTGALTLWSGTPHLTTFSATLQSMGVSPTVANSVDLATGAALWAYNLSALSLRLSLSSTSADGGTAGIGTLTDPLTSAGTAGSEASSAANAARLRREYLRQAEKYGDGGVGALEDGRFRFYGEVAPAETAGEMAGRRLVREWDPASEATRTWHETLDHAGNIRQVRPQTGGPKVHYMFDADGNYLGSW